MTRKRLVLHFPRRLVERPIVYELVKQFDLRFNILKASVTPREEGLLVMELDGPQEGFEKGVEYLESIGVVVQPLGQDVVRDEARCNDCGACVPVCPTEALVVDRETMKVEFDSEKCIACERCIPACPVRAMSVNF